MENNKIIDIVTETYKLFINQELAPVASQLDEEEKFPLDLVKEMGRLNLLGIPYPLQYGGIGLSYREYIDFIIELAKTCGSTAMTILSHSTLSCNPIFEFGTEEQKEKYLKPMLSGEKIGSFALTEPGSGSDMSSICTTAEEKDEYYLLNGSKVFVTNGGYADVYIVAAKTNEKSGILGISCFIVEKGMEGVILLDKRERKLGMRASDTASLSFHNAEIPKENLLGKKNLGIKVLEQTLIYARLGMSAIAIGISEGAKKYSLNYIKQRKQFNKPLYQFQLVKKMVAEMEININASRLLLYKAIEMKEEKKNIAKEASEAKLFASTSATEITKNAVQLMGGYGCSREFPVERFFRDAKITEIGDGTTEIQYIIIADELIKRNKS